MWALSTSYISTLLMVGREDIGVGTEQTAEDSVDSDVVRFVALRPISPGEELFIDYGHSYDRSSYSQ